jgi:peptidyl-prolyl cis-trans isomerase C
MNRTTKSLILLGVAAPLMAFSASPAQTGQTNSSAAGRLTGIDGLFTNLVVARGKGVYVTRNQLDDELVRVRANLVAQGRSVPLDNAPIERQVLDGLIFKQLAFAKSTEAERAKGKEQFEKNFRRLRAAADLTDEEFEQRLNRQLKVMNVTKEEWERQNVEQETIPFVVERELKVNVTDAEVKKFYDENPARFERPEMVRVAHILLGTRDQTTGDELPDEQKALKHKQMEDILKRARAGEDFAKLAKEYSEDPGSKDRGGEYTFPRGQMMPEFEAAAFALSTNQVSNIVTTRYGHHIIKLHERIPAEKTAFDKVSADIKDYLRRLAIQQQIPEYIQKLEKDAGLEILDARLKPPETSSKPAESSAAAPAARTNNVPPTGTK